MSVTVQSVLDCVSKQKSGPDGIAMEAIINGARLTVGCTLVHIV